MGNSRRRDACWKTAFSVVRKLNWQKTQRPVLPIAEKLGGPFPSESAQTIGR